MERSRGVRDTGMAARAWAVAAVIALMACALALAAAAPAWAESVSEDSQSDATEGEVLFVTYPSDQSLLPDGQHPLGVYLPAGWDPDRTEPYPLLVLSHGAGGDERSWFEGGGAAEILDTAIADGVMAPTVVVTTLFEELTDAEMLEPGFYDAYAAELEASVLPFVEQRYNVSGERIDRSFGGLSMGGGLGLSLLMDHPDLFARYGLWSAAADVGSSTVSIPTDEERERMTQAHVIHMGTGVHDELWSIGQLSQERATLYRDLGLPIVSYDIAGGHTWDVWRLQLDHFVRGAASEPYVPQPRSNQLSGLALALALFATASLAILAKRRRGRTPHTSS